MRKTFLIDGDVAELIKQEARRSGESFEGTVDRLLRLGLAAVHSTKKRTRFVVKPLNITLPPGLNFDKTEEILGFLEGPEHK